LPAALVAQSPQAVETQNPAYVNYVQAVSNALEALVVAVKDGNPANIDKAVERSAELIALDDALQSLAEFDEQKARMVELRYFGGLSIEETADVLGVTPTTIKRHWRFAKAWLHGEMQKK